MNLKRQTFTMHVAEKSKKKSGFHKELPQILAVMVKNVLLMAYGMTIGYLTILIPGLSGNDPNEIFHLNEDEISWIGSVTMMFIPIGCLLSGVATQPIGRKRAMQIINLPFIICWLIFKFANRVWHLYLALALIGLFGGLVEAPVLTYVSEITQPHLRGMLSATSALAIILGILVQFLLGTILNWRTIALVSCAIPISSFCLLCLMPESPHWLIMNNKMDEARKSLAWLRGWTTVDEIEAEFREICNSQKLEESINDNSAPERDGTSTSFLKTKIKNAKNFFKKNFLWPLAMVSFIYFLGHFTGSTTLQTYAVKIFVALQVPIDEYYATVLLGIAELIGAIMSVYLVHNFGKRVMAFISITGIGICTTVIATYAYITDIRYFNVTKEDVENSTLDAYKWVPLVFIILLAFISHSGLRVLPWILIGEIYSYETRSTGCGISGAVSYVFGFSANKTFLRLIALMTIPGVYWFYGGLSFIGLIIVYFILPETEGKTLQDITDHFSGTSKLGNNIKKKEKSTKYGGKDNPAFDGKVPEGGVTENNESKL